jgi:hypothetical protein
MLTFVKNDDNRRGHGIYECKCGTIKSIRKSAVNSHGTKSCGCHRRETASINGKMVTTHGMCDSPIYRKWAGLKTKNSLCMEWQSFEVFYDFVKNDWNNGMTHYPQPLLFSCHHLMLNV